MSDERLLAIVGPTASGKTALALEIARRFRGEIIAADSRTVYRGMDIGTAKPTTKEQRLVPHHLLDLVRPNQPFSVAEFKVRAEKAITEIRARGHLPLLVGGTGLYVDAVLYDYRFRSARMQPELHGMTVEQLQERASQQSIKLNDSDWHNPRRLVRAIESQGVIGSRSPLPSGTLLVGLTPDLGALKQRIAQRIDHMVEAGFEDEVRGLIKEYSDAEALTGIGYRAFARFLKGEITLEAAKSAFVIGDYRLAKRQLTWLKRNPDIHWFRESTEAATAIAAWMAKPL